MGTLGTLYDINLTMNDMVEMENTGVNINVGTLGDFAKGVWDGLMDMIPDNILGWVVLGIGIAVGAGLVYLFGPIVLVVAGIAAVGMAIYGSIELYKEGNSLAYSIGHGLPMAIAGAMGVRGGGASMLASGVDELETYGAVGSFLKRKNLLHGDRTQLEINRIRGHKFNESRKNYENKKLENSSEAEITIKTNGKNIKTRVDNMGFDKNSGELQIFENKSSKNAPLTKNQEKAFPDLEEYGGEVVGKGKGIFTGGYQIPPTKVEVIRPWQFKPKREIPNVMEEVTSILGSEEE